MTFTTGFVMDTDPRHLGEVFHLTLEHDPRGSPADVGWKGGRYAAHGLTREKAAYLLRRLAVRLELGESVSEITTP